MNLLEGFTSVGHSQARAWAARQCRAVAQCSCNPLGNVTRPGVRLITPQSHHELGARHNEVCPTFNHWNSPGVLLFSSFSSSPHHLLFLAKASLFIFFSRFLHLLLLFPMIFLFSSFHPLSFLYYHFFCSFHPLLFLFCFLLFSSLLMTSIWRLRLFINCELP